MEIYGKDLSEKWELVRFEIPNGVVLFEKWYKFLLSLFVWRSGLEFTPWWNCVYKSKKLFSIINLKGPKIALLELFLTFNANFEKFLPRRKIEV